LRKTQFDSDQVKRVYEAIPESARIQMLALRELIYTVAKNSKAIGALEETLKWGESAIWLRLSERYLPTS
jgi:hypothetical protein